MGPGNSDHVDGVAAKLNCRTTWGDARHAISRTQRNPGFLKAFCKLTLTPDIAQRQQAVRFVVCTALVSAIREHRLDVAAVKLRARMEPADHRDHDPVCGLRDELPLQPVARNVRCTGAGKESRLKSRRQAYMKNSHAVAHLTALPVEQMCGASNASITDDRGQISVMLAVVGPRLRCRAHLCVLKLRQRLDRIFRRTGKHQFAIGKIELLDRDGHVVM